MKMLKKFQKIIFRYLKNMKASAHTGATVIGCKCYRVQLVLGSTVFHPFVSHKCCNFVSNIHLLTFDKYSCLLLSLINSVTSLRNPCSVLLVLLLILTEHRNDFDNLLQLFKKSESRPTYFLLHRIQNVIKN